MLVDDACWGMVFVSLTCLCVVFFLVGWRRTCFSSIFLDNHFCDAAVCCVVGWLFVFCLVSGFPDLFDSRCFFLFFVESLILAQDERWRRA